MARHVERSLPLVSTWRDILSNFIEGKVQWFVGWTNALRSSTALRPSKPTRESSMVRMRTRVSFPCNRVSIVAIVSTIVPLRFNFVWYFAGNVPCDGDGCPKMFKNRRNMREHFQRCEYNPDRIKIYCDEPYCDFFTYQTKDIKRFVTQFLAVFMFSFLQ